MLSLLVSVVRGISVVFRSAKGDDGTVIDRPVLSTLQTRNVTRWQKHHRQIGFGHVYQGRFKSFPVEADDYFYQVVRYVERNALRANLVSKAEQWPWSSLWIKQHGSPEHHAMLSKWPIPRPRKWLEYVNAPASEAELDALRRSGLRGTPYGSEAWVQRTATNLGLEASLRNPGRLKKR